MNGVAARRTATALCSGASILTAASGPTDGETLYRSGVITLILCEFAFLYINIVMV